MNMRILISLVVAAVSVISLFSGCKKETEGPVLFVTPNQTQFTRQPGQLMEFSINASAKDGLQRLRITKNENQTVTQTMLDTALTGNSSVFQLPFQVPQQGVTQIYFVFTLTDNEGRQVATPRRLIVEGAALLQESQGHVLYSIHAGSGANRAFNIANGNSFQITAEMDSSLIDVMDYDQVDDGVMSRQWTSGRGLEFVRLDANAYNYAQATFASAKTSYQNGNKVSIVNNVAVGDKIITRYSIEPERYAVFDIQEVIDLEGSADDRYRFNMKK